MGLALEDVDTRRVPDGPQIKAETWFSLALAASIIALCIFVGVAAWVFNSDVTHMTQRAQAFTPFGAALIAVVTFCTIAWRGVLNTKQLEYQAEQIAHQAEQLAQTRRQNDAKDDENLAKLLMDGTKLLGETRQSHVLAGVAALQAVVVSPKGAFASQAMDILVDLIEETFDLPEKAKMLDAAKHAVNLGGATGRRSTRNLKLHYDGPDKTYSFGIVGVRSLSYKNAEIDGTQFPRILEVGMYRFEDCNIEDVRVDQKLQRFKGCHFFGCQIKLMSGRFLTSNTFEDCDFSGAVFKGGMAVRKPGSPDPLEHLKSRGNFFFSSEPITGRRRTDWAKVFDEHEVITEVDVEEVEGTEHGLGSS